VMIVAMSYVVAMTQTIDGNHLNTIRS